MSVFEQYRAELEKHEFMMGITRGRLAVGLDLLTDALVLTGQHSVYCHGPGSTGRPARDLDSVRRSLAQAKELVQSVMEEIRREKEAGQSSG